VTERDGDPEGVRRRFTPVDRHPGQPTRSIPSVDPIPLDGDEGSDRDDGDPGILVRWARSPLKQGLAFVAAGFAGVFLRELNLLLQLVAGAPVFEEFLKFGAALALASLIVPRYRIPRVVLALAVGAGFGLFEHWVTYPDEPAALLRTRMAFHAGAPALSMAVYDAITALADVRVRWMATLPATLVHAANNVLALVFGLASVAAGSELSSTAIAASTTIAAVTYIALILALAWPTGVQRMLGGFWAWFAAKGLGSRSSNRSFPVVSPRSPDD